MKRSILALFFGLATTVGSMVAMAPAAHADDTLLAANPCPAGYKGVILTVDNHNVQACENVI